MNDRAIKLYNDFGFCMCKKDTYGTAMNAMPDATIYGEVPEEIQKKVLVIESKEKQTAQLKEITDKLEQGVQDVFQSDSYKELLNVMARINPITKYKTGTLKEYLPGVEKYLEEKSRKTPIKDKLVEKKKAADARTVAVEKNVKKKSEEIR